MSPYAEADLFLATLNPYASVPLDCSCHGQSFWSCVPAPQPGNPSRNVCGHVKWFVHGASLMMNSH